MKAASLIMQHPHDNLIRIYNVTCLEKRWLLFFMALGKCNLLNWLGKFKPEGLDETETRCVFR